jgi:hypothetical protein
MGLFFSSPTAQVQSSSGNNTAVACLSSSPATALIVANPDRKSLSLENLGNKTVFVGFTNAVTSASYAIALKVGALYEFPVAFTGALFAIAQSGTQNINVVEMT